MVLMNFLIKIEDIIMVGGNLEKFMVKEFTVFMEIGLLGNLNIIKNLVRVRWNFVVVKFIKENGKKIFHTVKELYNMKMVIDMKVNGLRVSVVEKELTFMLMVTNIKVIGLIMFLMEKVITQLLLVMCIVVVGKLLCSTAADFFCYQMENNMKENLKMEIDMEKGEWITQMDNFMLASGRMDVDMERAFCFAMWKGRMMVISEKILKKVMELCNTPMEMFILETGRKICTMEMVV
mmetsp:Transcript_113894/g.170345  ORF Transcript_113894/g.170345 Transcript_113894/m.170345 type:complete len:235 (-) Transcript_113894:332-1036(-)